MEQNNILVEQYLAALPKDRQAAMRQLRQELCAQIDPRFEERVADGVLSYVVPLSIHPDGYLGNALQPVTFISLASQKSYIALYHMGVYAEPSLRSWLETAYRKANLHLDMGKSCVRFRRLEDIPYDIIGELAGRMTLASFLNTYVRTIEGR
jgi:hypothetical protein